MCACTGISGQQIFINIPLLTYIHTLLSLKYYAPDTRFSVNMTWRYCTCICKLLMFQCSRSVQMLHNVKKNNIDLFEVHVHVSSFQIHVHVQLQINLKCTDARPQIIWSYMRALSEHQTTERKRQVTLIKKVLIILKILLSYGHLNIHVHEETQCQHLLHPFYWRKQDVDIIRLLWHKYLSKLWVSLEYNTGPCRQQFVTMTSWDIHLI